DCAGVAGAEPQRAGELPPAARGGGDAGGRLPAPHRPEAAGMRSFWVTVQMGLRMYLRDRGAVFWGIVFPLILMTLIGLAFGRTGSPAFAVAVVDRSGGLLGRGVLVGLRQVPVLRVEEAADTDAALARLRAGRLTLVIVVPAASSTAPIRAFFDQARVTDSQMALMILERFVAEANLRLAGAPQALRLQTTGVAGRIEVRFFDFLLPVFLAGTFWPKDFMPKAMQPVIGLLPLTPLVDVMRGVATRGDPLTSYLPGLAYLAAWGAVSLFVAARRFKWE